MGSPARPLIKRDVAQASARKNWAQLVRGRECATNVAQCLGYDAVLEMRVGPSVRLEQMLPINPKQRYPFCRGGARACPPEDCGGPWGFLALQDHFRPGYTIHRTTEMLQELAHQRRILEEEEHEELSQLLYWLTADRFPRRLVNQRLRWYATDDPCWRDALCL